MEDAGQDSGGTDTSSSVAKQPQPPEDIDKKVWPLDGTNMSPNTDNVKTGASTQSDVPAESPYVPIPADLPISPYSCIEQTADNSAGSNVPADSDVRPQETVIGGTEGTKCDGYVPWSSTQPSA